VFALTAAIQLEGWTDPDRARQLEAALASGVEACF